MGGSIAGTPISDSFARGVSWSFVNGGTFIAEFGADGYLKLQFSGTIANDQLIAARGILKLPTGSPAAGGYCFDEGSVFRHHTGSATFVLRGFTRRTRRREAAMVEALREVRDEARAPGDGRCARGRAPRSASACPSSERSRRPRDGGDRAREVRACHIIRSRPSSAPMPAQPHPTRRVRIAFVASVVLVAACRQVVGIDDRTETPTLTIASADCRACLQPTCEASMAACVADRECEALASCVLARAKNDVAGRLRCIGERPAAAATPAYRALDGCVRASCLEPCFGTGGLMAAMPASCSACLSAPAPQGCGGEIAACLQDAACERECGRAYAVETTLSPPFAVACGSESTASDERGRNLAKCSSTCLAECPFKHAWDCVGGYVWPGTSAREITTRGQLHRLDLATSGLGAPAVGATVEACAPLLVPCVPTKATTTDERGQFALAVDAGSSLSGWRGYFRVSGSVAAPGSGSADKQPLRPGYYFPGRPLLRDEVRDPHLVLTVEDSSLATFYLARDKDIPGRSHLFVVFLDCSGRITPDVELSISPSAIVEPVGTEGATAFNKVSSSSVSASYVFNAKPGCVEITGKVAGKVTHRSRVVLFADAYTSAFPMPIDRANDPIFTCTPP